ncbi:MAG: hypothetical protein HOM11_08155, partial [Methylococcales bacterium]|nr:hypothetical protein [Methylococcales bacterium]
EVTLQPLRRFELDAAILFSDILTIPHAMNLGLEFIAGKGPTFSKPVRDENAVLHLPIPDPEEDLGYVMDAIRLIKKTLNDKTPLIGFAGSPWTVATYMVEGGSSKQFSVIKRMLYRDPDLLHALLEKVTLSTISYLQAQIAAGVDAIMIFDTWGGVLTPEAYQTFSLQYMQRIIDALPNVHEGKTIPTILTTSRKLSTGVDARNVRNIVLMRPCNNMIEFKQIIGRGTRLYDGKDYFTVYFFCKSPS